MFELTPFTSFGGLDPFRVFDDFDRSFFPSAKGSFKTDVISRENEYVLEAELPGFKKEEIKISTSDGYLTITAEHKDEKDEKNEKGEYVRRERSYGSFSRSFGISGIDEQGIKANFENGVLKLTLPRLQPQKPAVKQIDIM